MERGDTVAAHDALLRADKYVEVATVAERSCASAEQVSASTQETSASTQEIAATANRPDELVGTFRV